jgi:hypothetical protein
MSYMQGANISHTVKHIWFNHLQFSGYIFIVYNSNNKEQLQH